MLDTHVNLSDLLDSVRTGSPVRIFATHAELVNYTRSQGRYFPKEDAYAGGLLKYLLREIENTYHGRRGKKMSPGKKCDISRGHEERNTASLAKNGVRSQKIMTTDVSS